MAEFIDYSTDSTDTEASEDGHEEIGDSQRSTPINQPTVPDPTTPFRRSYPLQIPLRFADESIKQSSTPTAAPEKTNLDSGEPYSHKHPLCGICDKDFPPKLRKIEKIMEFMDDLVDKLKQFESDDKPIDWDYIANTTRRQQKYFIKADPLRGEVIFYRWQAKLRESWCTMDHFLGLVQELFLERKSNEFGEIFRVRKHWKTTPHLKELLNTKLCRIRAFQVAKQNMAVEVAEQLKFGLPTREYQIQKAVSVKKEQERGNGRGDGPSRNRNQRGRDRDRYGGRDKDRSGPRSDFRRAGRGDKPRLFRDETRDLTRRPTAREDRGINDPRGKMPKLFRRPIKFAEVDGKEVRVGYSGNALDCNSCGKNHVENEHSYLQHVGALDATPAQWKEVIRKRKTGTCAGAYFCSGPDDIRSADECIAKNKRHIPREE